MILGQALQGSLGRTRSNPSHRSRSWASSERGSVQWRPA